MHAFGFLHLSAGWHLSVWVIHQTAIPTICFCLSCINCCWSGRIVKSLVTWSFTHARAVVPTVGSVIVVTIVSIAIGSEQHRNFCLMNTQNIIAKPSPDSSKPKILINKSDRVISAVVYILLNVVSLAIVGINPIYHLFRTGPHWRAAYTEGWSCSRC